MIDMQALRWRQIWVEVMGDDSREGLIRISVWKTDCFKKTTLSRYVRLQYSLGPCDGNSS